ncbi:MAG: nuclear transport factor 2 family protein [Solirubrobacterales bacterium]
MSEENVEFVRRVFAATKRGLEDGEVSTVVRDFYDREGQYEPVEEAKPLRGHDQIVDYFRRWLTVWDDFRVELEEVIDAGDQVVSVARSGGRAKASGVEVSQRIYSVIDVRNDKIFRNREFLDRREALEAAGLSE